MIGKEKNMKKPKLLKKIIALLLVLVMVLGLVACGAKEAPKAEDHAVAQRFELGQNIYICP